MRFAQSPGSPRPGLSMFTVSPDFDNAACLLTEKGYSQKTISFVPGTHAWSP